MKRLLLAALIFCLLGATACVRTPGGVAPSNIPLSPGGYTELGPVEAQDCKINLLGIIPISSSNYLYDAVDEAMQERSGTDALVNITVDRVFKFFILWSEACTEVRATAVRLSP